MSESVPFSPAFLPHGVSYDSRVMSLSFTAERLLGEYKALLSGLPNLYLLMVPLVRREAVNSAQIEGSESTFGDTMLFGIDDSFSPERRDDLQEITNYANALASTESELTKRPLSLWLLRGTHQALLGNSARSSDKEPGTFRSRQNWIGPPGALMDQSSYIPPAPEKVPELMENWLEYWHSDQPSLFVQMALLHGQFEIIHPFMDGNGRVGRLLLPLFLFDKKILDRPVFYLSGKLVSKREAYYHGLKGLNSHPGDWQRWVVFFLETCVEQLQSDIRIVKAIDSLHQELRQKARTLLQSRYSDELMDAIFAKPVFTFHKLDFSAKPPSRPTLDKKIALLVDSKILEKIRPGSRGKPSIYRLPSLISLLENSPPAE